MIDFAKVDHDPAGGAVDHGPGLTFADWCRVQSEFEWFVCGDCGLIVTPGTHHGLALLGNFFALCQFEFSGVRAPLAFA
jgi:hypothetical protein